MAATPAGLTAATWPTDAWTLRRNVPIGREVVVRPQGHRAHELSESTPIMLSEAQIHRSTVAGRPDRVIVDNLCVSAFIGVHDFERLERQRVRFDVEVDTVDGYADIVRATGDYVSYADIVEFVTDRAATDEHVELVETWAEDVASFVLRHELAAAVRVRVTKPDIFDGADGVGVSIDRRRSPGSTS